MHSSILLSALSGLALVAAQKNTSTDGTGLLGDAAIVTDNPVGVTYTATLPNTNRSDIRGFISGTSNENGTGVVFTVEFTGFNFDITPEYIYHIHDQPVPANGNCTATRAHQDPYIRGEQPPCNATAPQTCQVGDLSGKHGNITTATFSVSYLDLYASTKEGIGAFFGNRSIVVHTANTTRLNCANFTLDVSGSNTTTDGSSSTSSVSPAAFTGGAATSFVGWTTLFAGLAAAMIL